ncbi:Peptidase C19, ubiquitin carboxyl-terminal hydrolase [Novymonas esmeraldas]|uniref:Ubiquitin carboxyl-terminal hydrolase n=1 Tax=Novymonas esmeraldas TaxID=1808958 RepID=A0AAW0F1Z4_9TRYP
MGNETSKSTSGTAVRRSSQTGASGSGAVQPPNTTSAHTGSRAPVSTAAAAAPLPRAATAQPQPSVGSSPSGPIPVASSSAVVSAGGTADGAAAAAAPRHVDAGAAVPYTLPCFTSDNSLASAASGGGGYQRSRPIAMTVAATATAASSPPPLPLPLASSSGNFRLGLLSSPLSPSRRHFPNGGASATSPIAVPTYNTNTAAAVEELSCSSPVLKSYRQHSFSHSKRDGGFANSPTTPHASLRGVASFSATDVTATATATAAGGAGTPSAAIHTKFLEITGYPLGLENYGNTCYCNSIIQLIYHCTPLRLRLLELHEVYLTKKGKAGFEEDTVLFHLSSLVALMHKSNNRAKDRPAREKIAPKDLLTCVRAKNSDFNNDMQQDAHEFAMFLLNDIVDTEQRMMADPANVHVFLQQEAKLKKRGTSTFAFWKSSKDKAIHGSDKKAAATRTKSDSAPPPPQQQQQQQPSSSSYGSADLTPLQVILQGQFGSLTACLKCNNVTARDEVFIDLSLETAQGTSLLRCLDHFGDPEYFYGKNKLRCDHCKTSVRSAKTIHVQQLPQYALLIHLKRFQYDVTKQNFTKKSDHVALPMQMDVEEYLTDPEVIEQNMGNDPTQSRGSGGGGGGGGAAVATASPETVACAPEEVQRKLRGVARHKARFELTGFVAHLGEGPSLGHYFTCVRYGPQLWRRFDDEIVTTMTERDVRQYFGVPCDATGVVTTTAYILLYERVA